MADPERKDMEIPYEERLLVDSIAVALTREAQTRPADGAESAFIGDVDPLDDLPLLPEAKAVQTPRPKVSTDGAESVEIAAEGSEPAVGASLLLQMAEDGFVSALAIVLIPGEVRAKSRRIAAVAQPMGFVSKVRRWLPGGRSERVAVLVPPRYVTDFASIPSWAHGVIHPFGRHAEAAVVHDWLYAVGPAGDKTARLRADRTFSTALKLLGVGPLKRFVMFSAVRLGGGGAFGEAGEFNFRRLSDLKPMDPKPDPTPYKRTVTAQPVAKPARSKADRQRSKR